MSTAVSTLVPRGIEQEQFTFRAENNLHHDTTTRRSRGHGYSFNIEVISIGWGRTTTCCTYVAQQHGKSVLSTSLVGVCKYPLGPRQNKRRVNHDTPKIYTPNPLLIAESDRATNAATLPWQGRALTILFPTPVLPAPPPPAASTAGEEAPLASVASDHITENTGKFTIGG